MQKLEPFSSRHQTGPGPLDPGLFVDGGGLGRWGDFRYRERRELGRPFVAVSIVLASVRRMEHGMPASAVDPLRAQGP